MTVERMRAVARAALRLVVAAAEQPRSQEAALREAFLDGFANGRAAPSDPEVAADEARRLVADYLRHPKVRAALAATPSGD